MSFAGRYDDLRLLREENWREKAVLVAVWGRRRVGKTHLIEHAFKDEMMWKFEGIENGDPKTQVSLFYSQLCRFVEPDPTTKRPQNWPEAFDMLEAAIQDFKTKHPDRRLIIFLDEFQWMCGMRTKLVSLFKFHWDNFFSRHPNCKFILCGSVSSFIVKKVLSSNALYGRVDQEIALKPLKMHETRELLPENRTPEDCLQTYMTFGGVPQYWVELNPTFSFQQNLNEYAFKSSGFYFREFDRLFISHFSSNPIYERILRTLSISPCVLDELANKVGKASGGTLSNHIAELEMAGFVERYVPLGSTKKSKLVRYRITDEYLHFFFELIEPNGPAIVSGDLSFRQAEMSKRFPQWQGYAFERLCRNHSREIAEHLQFAGIKFESGTWFNRGTPNKQGAQVDLAFKRADKMITMCEFKYTDQIKVAELRRQLENKVANLKHAFPGHGVETVLIVGKELPNWADIKTACDRAFLAEEVFLK